jgi:hypothetical protein
MSLAAPLYFDATLFHPNGSGFGGFVGESDPIQQISSEIQPIEVFFGFFQHATTAKIE